MSATRHAASRPGSPSRGGSRGSKIIANRALERSCRGPTAMDLQPACLPDREGTSGTGANNRPGREDVGLSRGRSRLWEPRAKERLQGRQTPGWTLTCRVWGPHSLNGSSCGSIFGKKNTGDLRVLRRLPGVEAASPSAGAARRKSYSPEEDATHVR